MASYILGLAIQKNNIQFINGDNSVGASFQIPTPDNGGVIDGDFWALPVNEGVYGSWTYQPYNPANSEEATAPNPFAFAVVRISNSKTSDYFYVIGTAAKYVTAAAGGTALPTTFPNVIHTEPLLPACQTLNTVNPTSGLYEMTLGIPSLAAGEKLYAFGYFNGTDLTSLSSSGYTDAAALLSALTSNWASTVGGTFTKTSDNLTIILTQSAGSGTDVFCGAIIAINPSL